MSVKPDVRASELELTIFGDQIERGLDPDDIEEGPGPGPSRQMCVHDPDGHGHMVAELFEGSIGSEPRRRRKRSA